jgi:hypothetical protein
MAARKAPPKKKAAVKKAAPKKKAVPATTRKPREKRVSSVEERLGVIEGLCREILGKWDQLYTHMDEPAGTLAPAPAPAPANIQTPPGDHEPIKDLADLQQRGQELLRQLGPNAHKIGALMASPKYGYVDLRELLRELPPERYDEFYLDCEALLNE